MRGATPTLVEQPKARRRPLPTVEPRQSRARPANGPLTCGRTKETHVGAARSNRPFLLPAGRRERPSRRRKRDEQTSSAGGGMKPADPPRPGLAVRDRNFSVWPPAAARTSAPSWGQVKFVTIIIITGLWESPDDLDVLRRGRGSPVRSRPIGQLRGSLELSDRDEEAAQAVAAGLRDAKAARAGAEYVFTLNWESYSFSHDPGDPGSMMALYDASGRVLARLNDYDFSERRVWNEIAWRAVTGGDHYIVVGNE